MIAGLLELSSNVAPKSGSDVDSGIEEVPSAASGYTWAAQEQRQMTA
jgi:hypothetical protein